ncbi:MAG: hypothetical protein IPJ88_13060 [Myxococcales bacterium]|nr:MAG: hypothetical protein IPJ88_13060 [Myxococcales bacterium]
MKIDQNGSFQPERRQFSLRFTCEDCLHFDEGKGRCAHDYPVQEHLAEYYQSSEVKIVFCKDFELR